MYSALGKTVRYKGVKHQIIGMAPASKVNAGHGMAALLVVDGQSVYVNTAELEK